MRRSWRASPRLWRPDPCYVFSLRSIIGSTGTPLLEEESWKRRTRTRPGTCSPGGRRSSWERWREWVDWSRREGFEAQALLLHDLESPQTFVSLGPWESAAAVRNWRTLAGYEERVARLSEVVESFDPRTLEIAVRH